MIDVQDLPSYMDVHSGQSAHAALTASSDIGALEPQEQLLLIRALETAAGNQSKAARLLRIGRDALRYKLKKHNLETPDSGRVSAAAG